GRGADGGTNGRLWRFCCVNNSSFQNFGDSFTAAMLQPMAVGDGKNRDHWNGQEDACYACPLRAAENSETYRERMQVTPGADYARIDHIVLNDSQDTKEQQDHERHPETGMQQRQQGCQNRHD